MNLAGPAGLVGFLAMFGEAGAFERDREFGLQFCNVNGEGRRWIGRSVGAAALPGGEGDRRG